jgi:hypothetical protein
MKLIKADESDNERLLHFFTKSRIPGSIDLRFRRMFSFFNHYRIQSNDFVTYMLINRKDELEAIASLLYRPAWIMGEKQTIGYATDLRVSSSRRAVMEWSNHFLPILEDERAKRNCHYTFSVIAHSQRQAYNALIRPRNLRRQMPRYYQYRKFDLVSIHGLWPFHSNPLPDIKVRNAKPQDFGALAEYLVKKSAPRPLRFIDSVKDVESQLEAWRDLYIENFLLAEDINGNIIGCGAPWSPQQIQRVYALAYSPQLSNLKDVLKLLSWFNVAHPLPEEGQELPLRHLSFLNADNPDIFYSILYQAFLRTSKNEVLVYPHFHDHLMARPPKGFITSRKQYGMYCVLSPNDTVPSFLRPSPLAEPPAFETSWL